ncbi:acyl-CoA synthetase FdrA [Photobacterium minamisatsumaniensis]|uniref:acyl-CoA synthetase FdrA n=1 Tax=Photobacterium minamisatsumaniensis TaxID=2910233 RepID=UPI003D142E29
MIQAFIKKGSFQDSVSLMLISKQLSNSKDVDEVSVMMGTPANKSLLEATGLWHSTFDDATPNDICVAIRTYDNASSDISQSISLALDKALDEIAQSNNSGKRLVKARRWQTAMQRQPNSNLALISVAGEYAFEVADEALTQGLNVMLFSDNVDIQEEVCLKGRAAGKGLIVMGPDCGTAMVAGAPLAFANSVPNGQISIVGASGTGIQELASQICLNGHGINHAIGLGGRDLSEHVEGRSALAALDMLDNDDESKVLAFVSKPPSPRVEEIVIAKMKSLSKPVVALFLGTKHSCARDENVFFVNSLADAGRLSAMLASVQLYSDDLASVQGKKILGLYTGGTLAAEAAMLLADNLGLAIDSAHPMGTMLDADGHKIIDLGDDHYTVGRPHPMIDPSTRSDEIEARATESSIGIMLVDLVLGYGATLDPAAPLVEAIEQVRQIRQSNPLHVIATVTGTESDPQQRSSQIEILEKAGVVVVSNLEEAVLLAEKLTQVTPLVEPSTKPSLLEGVQVINVGLRSFAEDLQSAETPVVHYQWAPIAGGNKSLASLLKHLK